MNLWKLFYVYSLHDREVQSGLKLFLDADPVIVLLSWREAPERPPPKPCQLALKVSASNERYSSHKSFECVIKIILLGSCETQKIANTQNNLMVTLW